MARKWFLGVGSGVVGGDTPGLFGKGAKSNHEMGHSLDKFCLSEMGGVKYSFRTDMYIFLVRVDYSSMVMDDVTLS